MSIRTSPWPVGVPCWTDLMAPDVTTASAFYADVLGWTFQAPSDDDGGYVIAEANAAAAAGIGPQRDGARAAWTLYFATDDADRSAAAVVEHGGAMLRTPGDVGPLGRMGIAADPTGAPFGLWQAGTHIGVGVTNEPGGLTWEDLRTPDPGTARTFYSALFGYRVETIPDGGDYRVVFRPGEEAPLGGIGGMMGADDTPPHWVVYFAVADAQAAVTAAERAGGTVVVPPYDTPYGVMAGLADPDGAAFCITQTDGTNQPDRTG
jgi:predicted enzyme related to lactoylglutathione lyase